MCRKLVCDSVLGILGTTPHIHLNILSTSLIALVCAVFFIGSPKLHDFQSFQLPVSPSMYSTLYIQYMYNPKLWA